MKKLTILIIVIMAVISVIFGTNYLMLGRTLSETIKSDPRNSGIDISVHYQNYINPSVLVFDVERVDGDKRPLDVFRVFLQFAENCRDKKFDSVILSSKGKAKFMIDGACFRGLGEEYNKLNPIYITRTFPRNVYTIDGHRAFPDWEGGLLGVAMKQMEDFNTFNVRWYIEDMR